MASSCPPERYLPYDVPASHNMGAQQVFRILPEEEAELAVVRSDVKPNCKSWFEGGPPDFGGGDPYELPLDDGRRLKGWQIAQVFPRYPLSKVLVCREEGGRAYLFRLTVAGMFTDFAKFRSDFERAVRSFSIKGEEKCNEAL